MGQITLPSSVIRSQFIHSLTAQAGRRLRRCFHVMPVSHLVHDTVGIRLQSEQDRTVGIFAAFLIHGIKMPAGTVVPYHFTADTTVTDSTDCHIHSSLSDKVTGSDLLLLCRSGAANLPPFQRVGRSSSAYIHCFRIVFGVEDTVPHPFLRLAVLLYRHGKYYSPAVAQRHSHRCIPVGGISLLVIDLEIG